jgi:hypothetical protein
MPRKRWIDITCPACKQVRQEVKTKGSQARKRCAKCSANAVVEARFSTKRRPSTRGYCEICIEDTRFEYFIKPPRGDLPKRKPDRSGRMWFSLCDDCLAYWLKKGYHRTIYHSGSSCSVWGPWRSGGGSGRPPTPDEVEAAETWRKLAVSDYWLQYVLDWRLGLEADDDQ